METELWYHGSPGAKTIADQGFDIDHARRNDSGDFGWGIYVVRSLARARCYGTLLGVAVDTTGCAYIPNPYFLKKGISVPPHTPEERLFHSLVFDDEDKMLTVIGGKENRTNICKNVRNVFLENGYTGILSDYQIGEMVIFDPTIILDVFVLE